MKSIITLVVAIIMVTMASVANAQDKVYKEGSAWHISFIKVRTGMDDAYIKSLKTTWKSVQDEAVKQGLVLSYKILSGMATTPSDWDMMLMVEYKNLAAMEGSDDKWDAILKKVVGGEEAMKTLNENRVSMREIFGEKVLREVIYK
jgi:hypothetical protein